MARPARARPTKLSHIDAHWDHADKGQHYDITKGSSRALHVDIGHVDLGHIDLGHIDLHHYDDWPHPHIDVDVPTPQAKIGHVDIGHLDVGHLDFGHFDVFHIDIHVDITKAPDPQAPDPIASFVTQVDNLIANTDADVLGFERERRELAVRLKELHDQLTKAIAKA